LDDVQWICDRRFADPETIDGKRGEAMLVNGYIDVAVIAIVEG